MTPEALAHLATDFSAAAVLCQQARRALEAGKTSSAYDLARTARNLLSSVIAELPPAAPPVDNSAPVGG